jgi:hypothetical protein
VGSWGMVKTEAAGAALWACRRDVRGKHHAGQPLGEQLAARANTQCSESKGCPGACQRSYVFYKTSVSI